ncbi:22521_t:CDS:2, partial [Dentiscutata erythropus]
SEKFKSMLCYYGKALTDALYDYQHRQHKDVLYDPNEFVAMLNNYNSNLKSFFDAIVEMTNPKGKSNETNEVNQCKVVGICYELAGMRIDALATLGVTASYKVIATRKQKLLETRDSDLEIYFKDQLRYAHFLNVDDYHDIHEKRMPNVTSLHTINHMATICVNLSKH